jgi:hypothetical protein
LDGVSCGAASKQSSVTRIAPRSRLSHGLHGKDVGATRKKDLGATRKKNSGATRKKNSGATRKTISKPREAPQLTFRVIRGLTCFSV